MLIILTVMVSIVCVFIFITSYQVIIHLLLFTFFVILKTIINNGELLSRLIYADLIRLRIINLSI